MTESGPPKAKPSRRRPQSDVLTPRQAVFLSIIAAIVIATAAVLYWNGFPIGETILPMAVGTIFLIAIGYTIKTGVLQWKGGGRTIRSQEPIAFWFWVLFFALVGLFAFLVGCLKLVDQLLK